VFRREATELRLIEHIVQPQPHVLRADEVDHVSQLPQQALYEQGGSAEERSDAAQTDYASFAGAGSNQLVRYVARLRRIAIWVRVGENDGIARIFHGLLRRARA